MKRIIILVTPRLTIIITWLYYVDFLISYQFIVLVMRAWIRTHASCGLSNDSLALIYASIDLLYFRCLFGDIPWRFLRVHYLKGLWSRNVYGQEVSEPIINKYTFNLWSFNKVVPIPLILLMFITKLQHTDIGTKTFLFLWHK